ncbi:MAG: hypothetical protein QY332_10635 [Anaerolineales bacterium]|nr:MAG: hypothetical protein QY332_10635 [Anaerolineales bacterium]
MDLSYLKSRTAVNVEPATNFGGGWLITLEDGEVIKIGVDVMVEQVRSPNPEPARFEVRSRLYQNYCHDVAHASAAIAALLQMDGSDKYYELEETCSGFPGIWELSARAGRALTDILHEVGDPGAEHNDFVDLCDEMQSHLIAEGKDLSNQELIAFARKIVQKPG